MKKFLLMLMFVSVPAFADAPWSAQEAKENARMLIDAVIEAQRVLKFALKMKDEQGWQQSVEIELIPMRDAFRAQSWLNNKNVELYEDCDEAATDFWLYSDTLFKKDSTLILSVRDSDKRDFQKYFASCKKAAGWHGR